MFFKIQPALFKERLKNSLFGIALNKNVNTLSFGSFFHDFLSTERVNHFVINNIFHCCSHYSFPYEY